MICWALQESQCIYAEVPQGTLGMVYFDSVATVYNLKVAYRRLPPLCRCYVGCFRTNKTTLSRRLGARRRLC
jgi:hypothetical protein